MQKGVSERDLQPAAAPLTLRYPWSSLGLEDRALVEVALSVLLAERSRAFRIAHDVAIAQRRTPPTVDEFELIDILRLRRSIAGGGCD
jgi:hypothetical protein